MEDLIEIKTKKEQTMTDLEHLKSEIVKNQTFLESLKKIKVREEMKVNHHSLARLEEVKQVASKIPTNHVMECQVIGTEINPLNGHAQFQSSSETQHSAFLNHEISIINDTNGQTLVSAGGIHNKAKSNDYMKPLRMNDINRQSFEQSSLSAPHLYSKHVTIMSDNQSGPQAQSPNNVRPQSLPYNTKVQNQPQQDPMLLSNSSTNLNKYGNNFPLPHTSVREQAEADNINFQRPSQQVSITQAQCDTLVLPSKHNAAQNVHNPNKIVVKGFIRPRAFSKEENITLPSELSKNMNNMNNMNSMNSHYGVSNTFPNLVGQPRYVQQTQTRQEVPVHRHFPEIHRAIATSSSRQLPQTTVRTTAPTPSKSRQPASILSKCVVCTKMANFLCSGCQKVYYCTVQCQVRMRGKEITFRFYTFIYFRQIIG